jgi:hypothetical protein
LELLSLAKTIASFKSEAPKFISPSPRIFRTQIRQDFSLHAPSRCVAFARREAGVDARV